MVGREWRTTRRKREVVTGDKEGSETGTVTEKIREAKIGHRYRCQPHPGF